jgi:HSP20 family molecular chaperone IbpA
MPLTLFRFESASANARLVCDWLRDQTTSEGPFSPINVFQQGGDLLAIIELPGVDESSLQIEAKENRSASDDYDLNRRLHRAQAFGRPSEVLNDPDLSSTRSAPFWHRGRQTPAR